MLAIENILSPDEARAWREALEGAAWRDGGATAGEVARAAKANLQLADADPAGAQLGAELVRRLSQNPHFVAAALPAAILPPRFNRYEGGGRYGDHIDAAILSIPGGGRLRGDLSATLFLSDPNDYEGGELVTRSGAGETEVKLPAGHLFLYPADTLHHVRSVTRGTRYAAFFWVQSLVRDAARRAMLLELDESIRALRADHPDHPSAVRLTGLYHNLLRAWAEV